MSIKKTFNGSAILKPGAYTKLVVENLTGFPLADTATVGIVGEAKGGAPGVLDIISKEQIQSAKSRYKSGPIADALELLANPSKDPRIVNGASKIVIWKTNASTQAEVMLANVGAVSKFKAQSKNYGSDENQISILPSIGSIVDAQAKIAGTVDGPFASVGNLILKVNGSTFTYTSSLTGSQSAALMLADLNTSGNWAPSKPVIASLNGQKIDLTLDASVAKLDAGSIKVDPASTLDTILGITGSARGVKGSRSFLIKKGNLMENLPEVGGQGCLSIAYIGAGTSCLLEVSDSLGVRSLKSTVVGAADALDIAIIDVDGKNLHTIQSLADLINSGGVYTASVLNNVGGLNANQLDLVASVQIKDVAFSIHRDDYLAIGQVELLSGFARLVDQKVAGALLALSSSVFLAGAVDGVSANLDFVNAFEAMKEERVNVVVPLISEDLGALTIDSINAVAADHAAWGFSTTGKSERSAFVSKSCSKEELKTAAKNINSGYVSIVGQEIQVRNNLGDFVWLKPWALACILAGMRAGAEVGEPLTAKFLNVNGIKVADGSWNPRKDFNEMIDAGVWCVEPMDNGGFRNVCGNTTYGIDPSFVWNRESVVQSCGYIAYDLRFNLELQFTGTKAKSGSAVAIANFIKARMTALLKSDIIVGDDLNEGLGYYAKTMRVIVNGNTAEIALSVTPVQGIDFILPVIYISDIKQSA